MLKAILWSSLLSFILSATTLAQTPCERLTSLKLENGKITEAVAMPSGPYLPAGLPPDAAQYAKIHTPAYCRLTAVLTPTADSHIEVALWMPARESWNGKYLAVGGGGWVGSFNFGG